MPDHRLGRRARPLVEVLGVLPLALLVDLEVVAALALVALALALGRDGIPLHYKALGRWPRHVTPKSYLELLKLYIKMLTEKRSENTRAKERLQGASLNAQIVGEST